jgi:hypothetical protein
VPPSLSDRGGVVRYRLVDVAPDGTRAEQGTRAIRIVAMREEAVDPSVVRLRLDPPVPTPAVDHVHARWTQAVRGATTLELIGPHGVLHRRIDAGVIDAGEHGLDIPLDDLASGRYLLVVSTAGAVRSQPCVVVR